MGGVVNELNDFEVLAVWVVRAVAVFVGIVVLLASIGLGLGLAVNLLRWVTGG